MNRNRRNGRRIAGGRHMMFGVVMCVSLAMAIVPVAGGASQTDGDGSSYTDPDFGWSISWDPEMWANYGVSETAANEDGVTGNEIIIGGVEAQVLGVVFVGSHTAFGGDLEACVETISTEITTVTGVSVSDYRDADLDLPEAPDGAAQSISYVRLSGGGMALEGIVYAECRPLVEDEAVLGIRWLLPEVETYGTVLAVFDELIAGIDQDGGSAESRAADEEASDEEAAGEEETSDYTDPTYGWSITWDPAVWEGQEPEVIEGEDEKEGNLLDLYGADVSLGGVTVASLPSPTFANDLAACVAAIRPQTHEELGGEDGGYVDNLREPELALPEAPAGAEGKLFEWDAGLDESQIGYFECRPLVEGEVVLFITWTLPVGEDYEPHLPAFEELMSGLDLSEVRTGVNRYRHLRTT